MSLRTYEVGEPFNQEDQAFVKKYVPLLNKQSKQTISSYEEYDFYNYKTSNDGYITAVIAGVSILDIETFNHSFGARYTTVINDGEDYLEEIEARVTCNAYGIVGSGGDIGLVYDETISASTDEFVLDFDQLEYFSGAVLYAVVYTKSVIDYQYGSFTVSAVY